MSSTRIIRTVAGMKHVIKHLIQQKKTIGFVPTMGALHVGHASLLNKAKKESDVVVCSIYANPTQFDNKKDLAAYPKTEKEDLALLATEKTDVAFIPQHEDIYFNTEVTPIDYGLLTNSLEGAHRPGHFNGMSTIVRRLFEVVSPHQAYFGEKDWQQLAIIKHMVNTENIPVKIIGCPIIREESGLALSSRNRRLSATEKSAALAISKSIIRAKELIQNTSVNDLENLLIEDLRSAGLKPDYLKIVNSLTFSAVQNSDNEQDMRILIAAYAGETRLIDNGAL